MPKRIIIADDYNSLRNLLQIHYQESIEDSLVDAVSNGKELVEKVKNENYDIVITDYDMGLMEMNGIEATRKIREFNTKIPIIIYSGKAEEIEEEALKSGANECIDKREKQDTIDDKIKGYLNL
jgi:CheY-like chemotaxis protein